MEQSQTNVLTYVGFGIAFLGSLITAINHRRVRSTCCKREISASFDVESTTPEIKRQLSVRPAPEADKI